MGATNTATFVHKVEELAPETQLPLFTRYFRERQEHNQLCLRGRDSQ